MKQPCKLWVKWTISSDTNVRSSVNSVEKSWNALFILISAYGHAHDDVIKWKHFPRYWPFVRGIHRSSVNSPHKGQCSGVLMFSLICARINGWANNREAGDLRRHRAHYDVIVMSTTHKMCTRLFVLWFVVVLSLIMRSIQLTYCPHGRSSSNIKSVISEHMLRINFVITSYEIALKWMLQNNFNEKLTLVWCRQAISQYPSQCWPKSVLPYGVS